MQSKNELKEIDVKNRTCYYFDDIIKDVDIYFSDILLYEKSYENVSISDISYKTSTVPKGRVRFDKIDGLIKAQGG